MPYFAGDRAPACRAQTRCRKRQQMRLGFVPPQERHCRQERGRKTRATTRARGESDEPERARRHEPDRFTSVRRIETRPLYVTCLAPGASYIIILCRLQPVRLRLHSKRCVSVCDRRRNVRRPRAALMRGSVGCEFTGATAGEAWGEGAELSREAASTGVFQRKRARGDGAGTATPFVNAMENPRRSVGAVKPLCIQASAPFSSALCTVNNSGTRWTESDARGVTGVNNLGALACGPVAAGGGRKGLHLQMQADYERGRSREV